MHEYRHAQRLASTCVSTKNEYQWVLEMAQVLAVAKRKGQGEALLVRACRPFRSPSQRHLA